MSIRINNLLRSIFATATAATARGAAGARGGAAVRDAGRPDAAPAGGQTIQASLAIDPSGKVIGVNPTNLGLGYTSEPSYTINNAGGGSGLQLEINLNDDGAIELYHNGGITPKLQTNSGGVQVFNTITADNFNGTNPQFYTRYATTEGMEFLSNFMSYDKGDVNYIFNNILLEQDRIKPSPPLHLKLLQSKCKSDGAD